MGTFLGLPAALTPYAKKPWWVLWRFETGKNGKQTKVPYRARDPKRKASCSDPTTWVDFDTAFAVYHAGKADGVGFCLLNSGLVAFDLDDCRNTTTGELESAARNLIARAKSYVEITPSGTGLRIIGTGNGIKVHRKQSVPGANGMGIESYRACERFITVTGNALPEATASSCGQRCADRRHRRRVGCGCRNKAKEAARPRRPDQKWRRRPFRWRSLTRSLVRYQ